MSSQIYPFTVLTYSPASSFFQIGQSVSFGPNPQTTSNTYAITSGTLPAGLSLNPSTGMITGTPTTLTPTSTILITSTLPDTTTRQCSIEISIIDIPQIAPASNQASATDLTSLMHRAESKFISEVNQMILNNNQLGVFQVFAELPLYASVKTLMDYYQNLGYVFTFVNWRNINSFAFAMPTGDFSPASSYWPWTGYFPYNDFYFSPRSGYAVEPENLPRVMISWFATPVCPVFPPFGPVC